MIETLVARSPLEGRIEPDRARRAIVFAMIGTSGIVVDGGLTALALSVGVWYLVANVAGYVVAVTWNFILNYRVTWGKPDGSVWSMYVQYLSADLGLFAVRIAIVGGLVELLGWSELAASLVGIVTVAAATFWVAETVVFGQEESDGS